MSIVGLTGESNQRLTGSCERSGHEGTHPRFQRDPRLRFGLTLALAASTILLVFCSPSAAAPGVTVWGSRLIPAGTFT